MARGIQNYKNVSSPDSDYPNGNIKDNTGGFNGTPFDKNTYSDMHQVFAKILRLTSITPNGLPENEYNGFQYLQAMRKLFCDPGSYIGFNRSISLSVNALFNPLIDVLPGSPASGDIGLQAASAHDYDSLCVTVKNDSSNSVTVYPGGSDTIGGGASMAVGAGVCKKICLDKANSNWIILY